VILSVLITFARAGIFHGIHVVFSQASSLLGAGSVAGWVAFIVVILLVSAISTILEFYAAISIGPHLTKNRLGGSALAFIIIFIVLQIIGGLSLTATVSAVHSTNVTIGTATVGDVSLQGLLHSVQGAGLAACLWILITNVVVGAVLYLLSRYFVKRKLNLA
jgi:hypothetical protein